MFVYEYTTFKAKIYISNHSTHKQSYIIAIIYLVKAVSISLVYEVIFLSANG